MLVLNACGGGGSGTTTTTHVGLPASAASVTDSNVVRIEVKQGPSSGNVNIPYVSVNVCTPGSVPNATNCRTVDNVLLDTGSTGLRLFDTALSSLALPPQTFGVSPVYECAEFVTTLALGTVRLADVSMGGETAAALPIQVMDSTLTPVNSPCAANSVLATATDASRNLKSLGANGILGVNHFTNDGQRYFSCATFSRACVLSGFAPAKQVQNPVSRFASLNNNGVVVQLSPSSSASGDTSVSGYLIFGVETQPNNRLGSAHVVPMNISGNYFTTTYNNRAYTSSIFDSGSNGVFFDDASIPVCSAPYADFYCPTNTQNRSATLPVLNAAPVAVDLLVANATALFTASNAGPKYVFNDLAAPITNPVQPVNISPYFIWGLPFYLGRSVYTVIEGKTISTGLTGPLNAFTN